jgi:hypothetical protein
MNSKSVILDLQGEFIRKINLAEFIHPAIKAQAMIMTVLMINLDKILI